MRPGYPTANALLALWARPHSPSAFRFALSRLTVVYRLLGVDVLQQEIT